MKPIDGAQLGGNTQYMDKDDEEPEESPTEMLGAEINERREQAEQTANHHRARERDNARQAEQWERVARACTAAQKQLMADAQENTAANPDFAKSQTVNG